MNAKDTAAGCWGRGGPSVHKATVYARSLFSVDVGYSIYLKQWQRYETLDARNKQADLPA